MIDWDENCSSYRWNLTVELPGKPECVLLEDVLREQRLSAIYGSEATLGLILNIILIAAIKLGSHTSKTVHVQLINMAIADILLGISMIYRSLPIDHPGLPCPLQTLLTIGITNSNRLWTVALSIERFGVTYFPFKALQYTYRKKVTVAVSVWICGFLLAVYPASAGKAEY